MKTFDRVPIAEAAPLRRRGCRRHPAPLAGPSGPACTAPAVTTVYETLERPLVPVLAAMERAGVLVDRETLRACPTPSRRRWRSSRTRSTTWRARRFNVGSPKQLGEILFDKMSLPGGNKGKTGAWSTPADVLEDLATEHDLPARVLDWRQIAKLKSTYTDALQDHINPETGRVHTSYVQTGANTGRLASTDPNLQNIPIRTEEGRRIREAFVAGPGMRWSASTTARSSCASSPMSPTSPALKAGLRRRAGHPRHDRQSRCSACRWTR
jgi:DNA polymerase I